MSASYRFSAGLIRNSRTLCGLKPRSTRRRFCTVRRNNPAPTRSISEIVTWATTSDLPRPEPERPTVRAVFFSAEPTSVRVAVSAGAMPKTRAVAVLTATTNASTRQSSGEVLSVTLCMIGCPQRATRRPRRAAESGEEEALGQQLPDQPPPRRAERQAHGDLRPPRHRARKQQVGDVRADDQQDERDDAAEHQDRAELAGVDAVHAAASGVHQELRNGRGVLRRKPRLLLRRPLREERVVVRARGVLKDAGEIAVHLRGGDAWLQPAHHLDPPEIRGVEERPLQARTRQRHLRLERHRHRDVRRLVDGLLHACELRREHADDGDRGVVDVHERAEDIRTAAKPRSPILVADDRRRRGRRAVVIRHDRAAQPGRHSERAVEVSGRQERRRDFRLAVDDHVDIADRRAGKEVRHRLVGLDELPVHRVRERGVDSAAEGVGRREAVDECVGSHLVGPGRRESNERVRIADGQRPEQQPVHGREKSGVGANAKGQRDEDDGRPALRLQHHACGESKISQHGRRLRCGVDARQFRMGVGPFGS